MMSISEKDGVSSANLQEYGCLVVVGPDLGIIGLSENVLRVTQLDAETALHQSFEELCNQLFGAEGHKVCEIVKRIRLHNLPKQIFSKKILGKNLNFKISVDCDNTIFEWEEQHKKSISSFQLNEIGFLFDPAYANDWQLVCKAVSNLLEFDQVTVCQILETGYSKIIAEHNEGNTTSLKGKEFSRSFFTPEVLRYYKTQPYRYIQDLQKLKQKFISKDIPFDLNCTHLCLPPEVHVVYLQSLKVRTTLTFPIIINDQMWGVIVAHHPEVRKVDLHKRKLCTFVVQNAVNKFKNTQSESQLEIHGQLRKIESEIKEQLANKRTFNCALVQKMDILQKMAKAIGVAIYNQGDVFFHGKCPSRNQFYNLVEYIQDNIEKPFFKDYNFALKHGKHIKGKLPFAGLMSLKIGHEHDYYIFWFREETPISVAQISVEEKKTTKKPKSAVHIWEEQIHGSSLPWDDHDIYFVQGLWKLINEAILSKAKERQLLTEELLSLNNELEMFSFTLSHDLKNPLSVLKMSVQFLERAGNMSEETRNACIKNIFGSLANIEDIINNMVTVSQSKMNTISKDPIPMAYTIQKISQDAVALNNSTQCRFHFGTLLPVWGEKSALYQVFLNLVGNAVKYSTSSKKPKVWINSSRDEHHVCYTIRDNGIGIPKEDLSHVFEMFSRADNALSFSGSGIGLSLVKRIMDRLNGRIEIRSQLGKHTEVKLYFPLVAEFPSNMLDA